MPQSQFEILTNRLRETPFLVVDPADWSVVLTNEAQVLDLTINRPGCVLILNALAALPRFAHLVGANDRTFDLKEIAAIMGVTYHTCHYYVREGYLVPSVQQAVDSGSYYQHLFDWTDAFAAGIIGDMMRAGVLLEVGCKVQSLLRRQLQLPEREEAPAQA